MSEELIYLIQEFNKKNRLRVCSVDKNLFKKLCDYIVPLENSDYDVQEINGKQYLVGQTIPLDNEIHFDNVISLMDYR